MMREIAHAKINLSLQIVGRRDDGYHMLDSLVVFAGIGDRLTAAPADDLSLAIEGPFASGLVTQADNLVLRAARGLASLAGIRPQAHLVLEKNLPVSSGIGGGSADAAACLRLLRRMWRLDIDDVALHSIAVTLGSDVPVCLHQRPARMQGVGDILNDVPALPECGIVLANPGVAVSTQAVFRERHGAHSGRMHMPDRWRDFEDFSTWLTGQTNDLQAAAIRACSPIAPVLHALADTPDCAVARMSGSGATCFGIYPTPALAQAACARLRQPGCFVWGGALAAVEADQMTAL